MVERFPGDGAAVNGFGRRHLHEDEACLLYEAEYSGVRIGANASPPTGRFVLVEPKPEPGLPAEYEEIARRGFSDEDAMRWARDDYLRDEMVRQRRALEEIATRKRGREDEHDVVILDGDEDEDAPGPSNPPRQPGEGCSRDGGRGGDDDDDGGDYTQFYRRLSM